MPPKEKETVKKEVTHAPAAHHAPAARPAHAPAAHHAAPASHTAHAPSAHAPATPKGRYTEAVGRRKTAIARVRIFAGNGKVSVNGKDAKSYFTLSRLVSAATAPMDQLQLGKEYDVSVHVSGGGIHAQAGAVSLGLARAIVMKDKAWKPRLRTMGFMTRDSRAVERKKYGLKKARRAPQWAKR